MKTDHLIDALARNAGPEKRWTAEWRIAIGATVGLAAAIFVVPALFGFRSDLGDSIDAVGLKAAFGVLAAGAAMPLLLELVRPNTRIRHVVTPTLLFLLVSAVVAGMAYVTTPPEMRMHDWLGGGIPECLYRIPLLALPIATALYFAVRGLGATRLTLAGAAIGVVSGALASIAYASCCPMDSALYVASWYVVAILFCAIIGAVFIRFALKW